MNFVIYTNKRGEIRVMADNAAHALSLARRVLRPGEVILGFAGAERLPPLPEGDKRNEN
jgi:hypothetical protein